MTGICDKCGRAPKVPGQGQRFCVDCKEAAAWARARKRQTRAVRERRPCIGCGGIKEPGHGRDYCKKCKAKRRKQRTCMSCPAQIDAPARKCERCRARAAEAKRAAERERHRRNRAQHPEWYAAYRKRHKDNQGARMRHRLRAEKAGRRIPPVAKIQYGRKTFFPVAPLIPFMRQYIAEHDITELGESAHVRPHTLQAVLDGHVDELRDFQADNLCIALGLQLSNVYLAQTG